MADLFTPLQVGDLQLPNRILMAPLTRCRASPGRVPNAMMAEYYRQRAAAGLILSEATSVDPMGVGYPDTPGIWAREQVAGWRMITETVHAAGGRMFLQLWHVGRVSHPSYLNGATPLAPSAIAPQGHVSLVRPKVPYPVPRELKTSEIPEIVAQYRRGAENAKEAGFDGVEIHGANGYLLDQFLQSSTNQRTDAYGGSVEKRARLLLEVTDAATEVFGAGRVGVHLAPRGDSHSMGDADPHATFGYVAEQLDRRGIAFICTREHFGAPTVTATIRKRFKGVLVANENFDKAGAARVVAEGAADAVAFGKFFIANPDLVERLRRNAPLNQPNASTFYTSGPEGYTDYPTLEGNIKKWS